MMLVYLLTFCFIVNFIFELTSSDCEVKPLRNASTKSDYLFDWLLSDAVKCKDTDFQYSSFDGWHHNLAKPGLGSVGADILRGWSGIKNSSFNENNWITSLKQLPFLQHALYKKGINSITVPLGMEIVKEIFDTGDPSCAERYNFNKPDYEKNYATPYIDGGVIYGTSNDHHSSNKETIDAEIINFDNIKCLDILRLFWIKCHNVIAEKLHSKCFKQWSNAKVFNEARKFTIAIQQSIYVYDWLPAWTSKTLKHYERYDPLINPQIEKLFEGATYLLQYVEPDLEHYYKLRKNEKWNTNKILKILELIYGAHYSSPIYNFIRDEKQFSALPDINHARKVFILEPYKNWEEFSEKFDVKEDMLISNLTKKDIKQVDSLLGGILESKNGPGPLFVEVIMDQFRRIRDGDRFWFENKQNNLFLNREACKIRQILFDDVFFVLMTTSNTNIPKNLSIQGHTNNEELTFSKTYNKPIILDDFLLNRIIIFFCILAAFCCGILAASFSMILAKKRYMVNSNLLKNIKITQFFQEKEIRYPFFLVYEYLGSKHLNRKVLVVIDKHKKQINILSTCGTELRVILFDINFKAETELIIINKKPILILRSNIFNDLVLIFPSQNTIEAFINEIDLFMTEHVRCTKPSQLIVEWNKAKQELITRKRHQTLLEMFFRVAFAQAFKIEHSLEEILSVDTIIANEIIYTKLTVSEFAEYFNMSSNNEFIKTVFSLVDRDQHGYICFREFLDFIILFANGKEEDKARLFFNLYDIDQTLVLSVNNFKNMLTSFSELIGDNSTKNLLKQVDDESKEKLNFETFKKIIVHQFNNLSRTNLNPCSSEKNIRNFLSAARETLMLMYRTSSDSERKYTECMSLIDKQQKNIISHPEKQSCFRKSCYLCEDNLKKFIWFLILTLSVICNYVFEAWNFYSHSNLIGIKKIMFSISKAANVCILFSHFFLFLTMCRNMANFLKNTYLHIFLPLNHLQEIHSYVGYILALFTSIHVIGKSCLVIAFMEFFNEKNCKLEIVNYELENFIQYKWNSPVSISGLILILLEIIICIFALPYLQRQLYRAFYFTHKLYPLLILFLMIHTFHSKHSSFYIIILSPIVIYLMDYCIGKKKKEMTIPVLKIEYLPSNVVCLIFQRPVNFHFNVGQWIRLAINQNNANEFHPFILSSTPYESNLRVYILPTDKCAYQLGVLAEVPKNSFPPIHIRIIGPYGIGLQQWRFNDLVVIIVDDTKVALFSSVLRDILYVCKTKTVINCKKVYFIWSLKNQKYFEWIVDFIREIEETDYTNLFSCHLFITELYQKFDLRTLMIYIFENYYQRISGRNIFTGLRAIHHFGKPKYTQLFESIRCSHDGVNKVVVFSSGSASLERTVRASCNEINRHNEQKFEFYFIDKLE